MLQLNQTYCIMLIFLPIVLTFVSCIVTIDSNCNIEKKTFSSEKCLLDGLIKTQCICKDKLIEEDSGSERNKRNIKLRRGLESEEDTDTKNEMDNIVNEIDPKDADGNINNVTESMINSTVKDVNITSTTPKGLSEMDTEIEDYPYIVSIKDSTKSSKTCGECTGSIITPYHVITIASCFKGIEVINANRTLTGSDAKRFYIRSGITQCNVNGTRLKVKSIFFDPSTIDHPRNGVALIELRFSTDLRIATMPPPLKINQKDSQFLNFVSLKDECFILGWTYELIIKNDSSRQNMTLVRKTNLKSVPIILQNCNQSIKNSEEDYRRICGMGRSNETRRSCQISPGSALVCGGIQYGLFKPRKKCTLEELPMWFIIIAYELEWIYEMVNSLRFTGSSPKIHDSLPLCLLLTLNLVFLIVIR